MEQNILFTNVLGNNTGLEDLFPPEPASRHIPDWYKNLDSYIHTDKIPENGKTTGTIKRCMPVFDVLNSGYILRTIADVHVSIKQDFDKDGNLVDRYPYYQWSNFEALNFHPISQAPTHPNRNNHNHSYPKWMNPWSIQTPPGYSTLFIQPVHRESVFTILPGVVDTDNYTGTVNFPFVLNDVEWTGLIPAGTPMVQVIPFKRDNWKMSFGDESNRIRHDKDIAKIRIKFFDGYKNFFRQTKEYK